MNYWLEVIEKYSILSLTKQSDNLIALIGVVTVFQARLKCNFLAGIWEKDVARGLLWDAFRVTYLMEKQTQNGRIYRSPQLGCGLA